MQPIERIETYVFFNFGTTGLDVIDSVITEIHMIAIRCKDLRKYFEESAPGRFAEPPADKRLHCRVVNDVMCFTNRSQYCSYYEPCNLSEEACRFLDQLERPLVLIAHNGIKFHFPLLKYSLAKVDGYSPNDFVCADSMAAFYDILEPDNKKTTYIERSRGAFPWPDNYYDKMSYCLQDMYNKRVRGTKHVLEDARDRNKALMEIALDQGFEFMRWVAENNMPLSSIQ